MKIWKKTLLGIALFALLIMNISLPVSAASAKINPKGTLSVGSTVTVAVTINASIEWCAANFTLRYNDEILQFQSADCIYNAAGGGIVSAAPATTNGKSHTFNFTFKALKAGTVTVSSSGEVANDETAENFTQSTTFTIRDATKSGNANLKSLSLGTGTLSPAFSASRTSYTATVPKNTEKCDVYATKADSGAKVAISGNAALKIGQNTCKVTVTAANGTQKVYTIVITRSQTEETTAPTEDPYEAKIDDQKYTLAADLTGVLLPNGFTASTTEYNGTEVAVAKDKNETFTLYYLKNAEEEEGVYAPYLLEMDQFVKLPFATFGNNTYIFSEFPENTVPPSNYYIATVEINGYPVLGYHGENTDPDFYYLYCFYNDGFGVYRYDEKENVLQRNPEFLLQKRAETVSLTEEKAPEKFTERFANLSTSSKIILFLFIAAMLVLCALIIFGLLRLVLSGKKNAALVEDNIAFAGNPDVFDDIQIDEDGTETPEKEE